MWASSIRLRKLAYVFFVASRDTAGGQRVTEAGSHELEVSESTQGTVRSQDCEPVARNRCAVSPNFLSTLGPVEMPGMWVVVGRKVFKQLAG